MSSGGPSVHIGIALSATELCAADLRPRGAVPGARRAPLEPWTSDDAAWPSLARALAELARVLGAGDARHLAIALLPPLIEVRRVELPPLGDDERQRLLARNAGRYFVAGRGPQLVGTVAPGRAARRGAVPVVAAAASTRLVAAIHAAAREAGWTIDAIAPAEGAWAAAAPQLWPSGSRRTTALVLVLHGDHTDLLQVDGDRGALSGVRRFRAADADADLIAEAVAPGGVPIPAFGRAGPRRELARALEARGVQIASPPAEWAEAAASPELLAAAFAGANAGPLLVSDETRATRRAGARRATIMVAAAAVVLALGAAALELWGVHRELDAVRAQRQALKPEIAATLVGRMSVDGAYRRLTELSAAEHGAPRWSTVLSAISHTLPDGAYLTGFRARGDSVVLDGFADRASPVFDAVERTPGLTGARAAAPVRREAPATGDPRERFTIAARIAASTAEHPARRAAP